MADKVQKIREEVARLKFNLIHGACASQIAMETRCKEEAYDEVILLLDSMQEEPACEDLENAAIKYAQDKYMPVQTSQAFKAGAKWQKEHLWKPADGEDLPEYDREVIVLSQPYPLKDSEYAVYFAHRPSPKGWDGKSVTTGKVEHYTPMTYDKGGWNIPDVVLWLDLDIPQL